MIAPARAWVVQLEKTHLVTLESLELRRRADKVVPLPVENESPEIEMTMRKRSKRDQAIVR